MCVYEKRIILIGNTWPHISFDGCGFIKSQTQGIKARNANYVNPWKDLCHKTPPVRDKYMWFMLFSSYTEDSRITENLISETNQGTM